jgi:hypothetical protein
MVDAIEFLVCDLAHARLENKAIPLGDCLAEFGVAALLSDHWPLCTSAVRGLFEDIDAMRCANFDVTLGYLKCEVELCRQMFEDFCWSKHNLDQYERTCGFTTSYSLCVEQEPEDQDYTGGVEDAWQHYEQTNVYSGEFDALQLGDGWECDYGGDQGG